MDTLAIDGILTLGQASNTDAAAAGPGLVGGLIGALISALIGGAIYGLGLMLLSGPIGKVKVPFGPAFKTMFVVTLVSGIIGVLVGLVLGPLGGFIQFACYFALSTVMINKNHSISMGRSAAISGILMAIAIVFMVAMLMVIAAIAVAAGAAGRH